MSTNALNRTPVQLQILNHCLRGGGYSTDGWTKQEKAEIKVLIDEGLIEISKNYPEDKVGIYVKVLTEDEKARLKKLYHNDAVDKLMERLK